MIEPKGRTEPAAERELTVAGVQMSMLAITGHGSVCVVASPQPQSLEHAGVIPPPVRRGDTLVLKAVGAGPDDPTLAGQVVRVMLTLCRMAEPDVPIGDNPWVWTIDLEAVA